MGFKAARVETVVDLPFFTAPDPALVRATALRDPLGVLPVWSGIGRELVPNLASGVSILDGIKAVLLIHWLTQEPLKDLGEPDFRSCFRLLEGLLEYWLWSEPGHQHCFGTRALENPSGFQVHTRDARTAVNGLYQYYSGSCRRAGLLDAQWTLEPQVAKALRQCWSAAATQALRPDVQRVLGDKRQAYQPRQVLDAADTLRNALRKVFSSEPLMTVLRTQLLGNAAQVAVAGHCAAIDAHTSAGTEHVVAELAQRLGVAGDAGSALLPSLTRVEHCEQFLVVLQNSYDLLRALDRHSLADAAARLEPHHATFKIKAERFVALFSADGDERDGQIAELASQLAQSTPHTFLQDLVGHHQRLAKERGAEPLLAIDDRRIVSPLGAERPLAEVLSRLARGTPWNNGYYLTTAAAIHRQLFEVPA